jgi:hypothetical protein
VYSFATFDEATDENSHILGGLQTMGEFHRDLEGMYPAFTFSFDFNDEQGMPL